MKITKFRGFALATFCSIALVSYVCAGNGGHGHGQGRGHRSGPGFHSDNSLGLPGKIGSDEHNDFFTSDNNPGKTRSEFGRTTAEKASANGDLHRSETAPVVDHGPKQQSMLGALQSRMVNAGHKKHPSPRPSATPGGIHPSPSPIPSATPGGIHPSPSPIPSATPGGTHPSPSPIPSATPGGPSPDPSPSATPDDILFPIDPIPTPSGPHGH